MPSAAAVPSRKPWYRSDLGQFLLLLFCIVFARSSLANHYTIPSGSMEPGLLPGDRVVVNLTAYGVSIPFTRIDMFGKHPAVKGDVVVFPSPENGTRLIKRVVAVAGDQVSVKDGYLTVNGQSLAIEGLKNHERFPGHGDVSLDLRKGGGPDLMESTVPAGKVLVMGDARGNSYDGRFFGWVEQDALYGRAVAIAYRSGEGLMWQRLK